MGHDEESGSISENVRCKTAEKQRLGGIMNSLHLDWSNYQDRDVRDRLNILVSFTLCADNFDRIRKV
jgi:hypothetical protein